MSIPDDIALIGYDNVSWEEGRYVGLTTIEQPAFNIGETAIRLLNDAAEGMQPVQSALISGNIIERRSV
jgi:DNA-binding LacI/PurR family transcriptional regulator